VAATNDLKAGDDPQSNDLQILSSLLIKERPAESSAKIKEILASENILKEKIRLILDIDDELKKDPESQAYLSRPRKQSVPSAPGSDYVVDSIAEEASREIRQNRRGLSHNQKMLKPHINQASLFKFIFSERKKIKEFGIETGIFHVKNLSTKILLNPAITNVFPKNINMITKELMNYLKAAMENGWYYLEKRDYNLIVLLLKLCREISHIDFKKINLKSPDLLDKIPAVELLFLILNYEPGDVRQLLFAVDTAYSKDPEKSAVNIRKLLEKDKMRPSLYNLIIGLNIMKTRTFLQLEYLKKPSLKLIDSHDYNCTPKVREKINEYLRNLEKGIQPYLEHEKEVYRLHAFIPTDGNGTVDYSLLIHFYDTVLQSSGLSYAANKDNMIKFILNLGYAFLKSFRDPLSESITMEDGQKVMLFAQAIFGQDLNRIELNLAKLDKIYTILPNFPASRCLFIKKSISGAIESEASAVSIIYEVIGTMVTIGKRLAHILRSAVSQSADNTNNKAIPFFSYDEKSYTIPYENQKIYSEGFFNGLPVKEALFQITGVCYQTGAFVQYAELSDLLAKEKQIHDEIRLKAKHFKRIAHEKVYAAFVEKYDIPQ